MPTPPFLERLIARAIDGCRTFLARTELADPWWEAPGEARLAVERPGGGPWRTAALIASVSAAEPRRGREAPDRET